MTEPYRILVTGSRDWADHDLVRDALATVTYQHVPAVIVHGACPSGADAMASWWVRRYQLLGITEEKHPAKGHPTEDFGPWPGAGPRRNQHMISLGADLCLAFVMPCRKASCTRPQPHGSHGTTGCADRAERAGITVRRYTA
ncbi:DUF2493 domain-containing protein [Streptomyces sp. NBC_01471]|uniref:SLOG family protein n=1 Tax=Streptomyces sp. NBC_01471 TaxID=2903879 RepID=UPI00324CDEB6